MVITIDGNRYGIWKDDVLSVREVSTVYGLPESPVWFAGIARIGDRAAHLMDIAALIGHRPFNRSRPGCVLIMTDGTSIEGFIADSEESSLDVPEGSTFPMPDYMACYGIDVFVLHGSELLPIIKIKDVYAQLRNERTPLPACTLKMSALPRAEEFKSRDFWMFTINGENYAVMGDLIERSDTCSYRLSSLPSAPDHVEGVVYDSGGVRAILDTGKRIGYRHNCDGGIVMFVKDGGPGLRVGSDARTFSGCTPVDLPPLAASELMQFALLSEHDIIPVLDVHALISFDTRYRKKKYTLRSRFHQHFGTKEVSVLEFTLTDMVLGLPYSQVEDVLYAVPFRTLRETHPLLLGVAERNGELLPVLSLLPCFARTALPIKDSKMILLKNGNFRVLLLAEKVLDRRSLLPTEQKALPINLPHRYVYGCYTDENSVRLILDVATIAMNAGEGKAREYIKTLMEKFVTAGSRKTKDTVPISCGNKGNDHQTIIAHTDDAHLPKTITISNNQLPVTDDRVIVKSVTTDNHVETMIMGDKEDPAGLTHEVGKEQSPVTQTNENNDINEDDEFLEAHKDDEAIADDFEKEDTEKRATTPVETDAGMDTCPVDNEEIVKIEDSSTGKSNGIDKDASECRTSRRDSENTTSGKEQCQDPEEDIAVTERGNNIKLKAGEGDHDDQCDTYTGDAKKIPSHVMFEAKTVLNRANTDVTEHMVTDTIESHDDVDEFISGNGFGNVELTYTGSRPARSGAERRGKGSYAIIAMGIGIALMFLLTYIFVVLSHNDVTAISETGNHRNTLLKETATSVNDTKTALSPADEVSSNGKMNAAPEENRSVGSVSGTPFTVPETPHGYDNDIAITSATKVGNGNERSTSGTAIETRAYVVEKGDTLWDIAEHFTGNPFNYNAIAVDNDIGNPDLIFPGQKIVIKIDVPEEVIMRTDTSP